MIPLVSIQNLSYQFTEEKVILKGIDLSIYKNSFTIITGKNGSGKTVLMKQLNGLLVPKMGDVFINGISVKKNNNYARKKIGFVFQNSSTQIIGQTVKDDIAFGPENMSLPKREIENRIEEIAKSLDIEDLLDKSPNRLSEGEKKKTAIAGILVMRPEIIILDEPFTGLDFDGVKMLLNILIKLKENSTSIIVITHDIEKVLAHADRLIVMADGRIVGDGKPVDQLKIAMANGIRVPQNVNTKYMSWLYNEKYDF